MTENTDNNPFQQDDLIPDLQLLCNEVVVAKMQDLLTIQDGLNRKFIGDHWLSEASQHGRVDYLPTILDEAAELMRSNTQWKFWKLPAPPDLANAKLEFIDMLHFAISEELAKSVEGDSIEVEMAAGYELAYLTQPNLDDPESLPTPKVPPSFDFQKHKSCLFRYLSSVFLYYSSVDNEPLAVGVDPQAEQEEADPFDGLTSMVPMADWSAFWGIAFNLGMTFEEIYLTYIAKVSLNELRILKGDRAGTYKKLWWAGLEDNYYLMGYVKSLLESGSIGNVNKEAMVEWLSVQYAAYDSGVGSPPVGLDPVV